MSIDDDVMAADFMGTFNGLCQGELWVCGGMDLDGRSTGRRQDLLVCHGQREDINRMCWIAYISTMEL